MAGCLAASETLLGTSGAVLGTSGPLLGASGSLLRTCGGHWRASGDLWGAQTVVLKDNIERDVDFDEVGCRQPLQRPGGRRVVRAPNL